MPRSGTEEAINAIPMNIFTSRNGIGAAWMEGVAFQDAAKAEIEAFTYSVLLNSLYGILGASGEKAAAMANERADRRLIEPQEKQHNLFHKTSIP